MQLADDRLFAIGQHVGDDFIHACLRSNTFCCLRIVSGEHDHAYPHIFQGSNSFGTFFFESISDGNNPQRLLPIGKENGCFALSRKVLTLCQKLVAKGNATSDKGLVATNQHIAVFFSHQSIAGYSLKIFKLSGRKAKATTSFNYSSCQGVFTQTFEAECRAQQVFFCNTRAGLDICDNGCALGDCARFVKSDDLCSSCLIKRNGSFKKNTVACTKTTSHHDSHRGGKT